MRIKDIAQSIIIFTTMFLVSSCSIMSTEGELEAPQKYTKKKIIDSCKAVLIKNGWEISSINTHKGEISASKPDTTPERPSSSKMIRTINIELDATQPDTIIYLSAASSRGQWSSDDIFNWFSMELRKSLPGIKVINQKK
ncbi:MAG TPA: hypothetical protein QF753_17135 [Victivallales bacterium]|nr:hypothetical protein [Victivallales bacterium]